MKIAQLSDFHLRHHLPGDSLIAKRRSRLMPELIQLALAQIASHQPDLLAITGDLVDFPLDAMDDLTAIELGCKDLLLIREVFTQASCPVAYLYGNHDHPASYRKIFADQSLDHTVGDYRLLTFLDDEVRDNMAERLGDSRNLLTTAVDDADPRPHHHPYARPQGGDETPAGGPEPDRVPEGPARGAVCRLHQPGMPTDCGDWRDLQGQATASDGSRRQALPRGHQN